MVTEVARTHFEAEVQSQIDTELTDEDSGMTRRPKTQRKTCH